MSKVPVIAALRAANAFRRHNARAAVGSLTLFAGGGILAALGQWANQPVGQVVGMLIEVVGWIMAGAALMRLAFADEHPGEAAFRPGAQGLQWDAQEWRFFGASALGGFIGAAGFLIPFIVAMVTAGLFGGLSDNASPVAAGILYLGVAIGVAAAVYLAIHLSLVRAASISSQRVALGWDLTRGAFWPILGAFALLMLGLFALMAASFVILALLGGALGVFPADPEGQHRLRALGTVISTLTVAILQLPLSVGLEAYLYRGLRPAPAEGV